MAKAPAKKNTAKKAPAKVVDTAKITMPSRSIGEILVGPRITEKAAIVAEGGVYTFNVSPRATKTDIILAVKSLYKVTPKKVSVVTIRQRNVFVRGKKGKQSGGKKALVYLKKGDKIEFV